MTARIRNPKQLVTNKSSVRARGRVLEAIRTGKAVKNAATNWTNKRGDGTFKKSKRNKYNARGRWIDDIFFDSKAEADRYEQLREMVALGTIDQLEVHPVYKCSVNGQHVCDYEADFRYRIHPRRLGQRTLIEDIKGVVTDLYRVKRRLVHALHPIEVIELAVGKLGSVARYRWITADQFNQVKDEPDGPVDSRPDAGVRSQAD